MSNFTRYLAEEFSKRAIVHKELKGDVVQSMLWSDGQLVAVTVMQQSRPNAKFAIVYGEYEGTIMAHVKEYLLQEGLRADTGEQVTEDYYKSAKPIRYKYGTVTGMYYLRPHYNTKTSRDAKVHVELDEYDGVLYRKATLYVKGCDTAYSLQNTLDPEDYCMYLCKTLSRIETLNTKEFMKQEGFKAENYKQMVKDYGLFFK